MTTNTLTTLTLNKAEICYLLNALSMSKREFCELLLHKEIKDTFSIKDVVRNTEKLITKIETASGVNRETV